MSTSTSTSMDFENPASTRTREYGLVINTSLKMKTDTGLDVYMAKFEQLARHAGYLLENDTVFDIFCNGLPARLFKQIIQNTTLGHGRIGSVPPGNTNKFTCWSKPTKREIEEKNPLRRRRSQETPRAPKIINQWRNTFSHNNKQCDPNAMDTTPGHVHA